MLLYVLVLAAWIATITGAQENQRPSPAPQGPLVLGAVEERQITSRIAHGWDIDVQPGQYVEGAVESAGMEVLITIASPSAKQTYGFDHSGYAGTQIMRWIAHDGGTWKLRVQTKAADASGTYRVTLKAVRDATDRDSQVIDADRLVEQGGHLRTEEAYAEAEAAFANALRLVEDASGADSVDVATVAANVADHYYSDGRYGEASALLERALSILQKTYGPESAEAGVVMNNLGHVYDLQARYRDAERLLRRALELRVRLLTWDHPRIGISLDNLATVYRTLGRYVDAELLATRALSIFEKTLAPDHYYVSFPLRILAGIHQDQGQYAEAEPLLKRALAIDEAQLGPSDANFASTLRGLATNISYQGRHEEAEGLFRRALAISEKAYAAGHPAIAATLSDIGRERLMRKDPAEAGQFYERSLAIGRSVHGPNHPNVASTLLGLVRVDLLSGTPDLESALARNDEAIRILDASGAHLQRRIAAYALRAELHARRQEPLRASADLAEAIALVEVLRPQTSGGEDVRAGLFEHYTAYYDRMVGWQLESGNIDAAFEYAERGRARVFLDQLAAGQVDLRSSIPPEFRTQLEDRETAARSRIAEYEQRITVVRSRRNLPDEQRLAEVERLERTLRDAHQEYMRVYADIKNASPLWRDQITSGGRPPTLRVVQRELVPTSGLMLLYQLGADQSHVFIIPQSGQEVLSARLTVSAAHARALGIQEGNLTSAGLEHVLAGGRGSKGAEAGLLADLARPSPARGLTQSGGRLGATQLHALWQVLVPERVRPRVMAAAEVVILPDGLLHQFPFEMLVTALKPDGTGVRYWLDEGPITRYAPSAAVLHNLTSRPARVFPSAGAAAVLSVSNPIYSPADVAARRRTPAKATAVATAVPRTATRNAYERFGGALVPLPGTAAETDAVLAAFGSEASRAVRVLQELEADEPGLRSGIAGKRYVHIATHALVGGNRGTLFAALVLTPPAGESGNPDDDGFLQLHEIYDLKLSGTELAILSACDTNRGTRLEGEGVFALSRGFLAAGVHRVIGSHWAVNDASTAQLMAAFFRSIVENERAARPVDYARALRDAQRAVRSRTEWSDPHFWAPFVLTGPP